MEKILETTDEFDVELFDAVIRAFYNPLDREHKRAESVLLRFREHPDSWARAAPVMKESKDIRSKAFALQVLERTVRVRWNMLTEEQQTGAREYIVDRMLELSMSPLPESKILVKNFNQVLIEVIKREWPAKWPTLIADLLEASKGNSEVCTNSFNLLSFLCDVIFNFHESLTKERATVLQKQMKNEFPAIYEIVIDILDKVSTGEISVSNDLINAAIKLLIVIVPYLPAEYLFEHKIVDVLSRYIESEFIEPAIQVLRKILNRSEDASSIPLFIAVLKRTFVLVSAFFEKYCSNFNTAYEGGIKEHYHTFSQKDKELIKEIVLFYGVSFKYAKELEKSQCNTAASLSLMLQISQIRDFDLFRVCMEFWTTFIKELYLEFPFVCSSVKPPVGLRRTHYSDILWSLVPVLVSQMIKPQEVIVVENEDKEIVQEKMVDTEQIEYYKEMNDLFFNISSMIPGSLGPYFCREIDKLREMTSWDEERVNKVCWSAGCITGSASACVEKENVTQSLQSLLAFCDELEGETHRSVVASSILYILIRNPVYIRSYPALLRVVPNKVIEFLLNVNLKNIKEMACETLLKLLSSCGDELLVPTESGRGLYITEVLPKLPSIMNALREKHYLIETIFEAFSYISSGYIDKLLEGPFMVIFTPNLGDYSEVMRIVNNIRYVKVVCTVSVSEDFSAEREGVIGKIIGQLQYIYESIQNNGPPASLMLKKNLNILSKGIVVLYTAIAQNFSINFILGDFMRVCSSVILSPIRSGQGVCSIESLDLLSELCKRTVEGTVPLVEEVITPVAAYAMVNPEEKEEHVKAFYRLLCASIRSKPQVDSMHKIEWLALGVGHHNRVICEESIEVLAKVIEKSSIEIIRTGFMGLLECVLGAALDKDHEGGMSSLLVSLSLLIRYSIEEKCPSQNQVLEILGGKLHGIFPHINPKEIEEFVYRCYRDVNSHEGLLENITDFRIKTKTV